MFLAALPRVTRPAPPRPSLCAVAALVQQYGGQELNFEEEILSDSDISQHFPEEDEDELAEQLGAGLLDSGELFEGN